MEAKDQPQNLQLESPNDNPTLPNGGYESITLQRLFLAFQHIYTVSEKLEVKLELNLHILFDQK